MKTAYLHDTEIIREENEERGRKVYRRPIPSDDGGSPAEIKVERIDYKESKQSEFFVSVDGVTVYAHPNLTEVVDRMWTKTMLNLHRRHSTAHETLGELHREFGTP